MKIEKIKKNGKKYKIILDNGLEIKTYDDVIINHNLLYNKTIDSELLDKINKENDYYDVYYKVINLLSKKLRSEKEIKEFLDKYDVDKNKIINKLKSINLINDKNFAKAYISDRINLSNDGIDKIKNDLLKHNIDLNLIMEEISKIDNELIDKKIAKLIIKKTNNSKYSGFKLKYKVVNDLINLGYDKSKIIEIYDSLDIKNDNLIGKEYNKLYSSLSKKYKDKELEYRINVKLYNKGFTKEEIDNYLNLEKSN